MKPIITNIYTIENLDQLKATYRLCKIRGLSRTNGHYYRNRQLLIQSVESSARQYEPRDDHRRRRTALPRATR